MKTNITGLAATLLIICVSVSCRKKGTENMNNADRQFLERTAYMHNGCIEFGNMAINRGENSMVKDYGQMEWSDHNSAFETLRKLADARNYKLPSKIDVEHIGYKISLETKSGRNFDSSYMNLIQEDHTELVGIMQEEIAEGNDEELVEYAREYLNTADAHKKDADLVIGSMNTVTR